MRVPVVAGGVVAVAACVWWFFGRAESTALPERDQERAEATRGAALPASAASSSTADAAIETAPPDAALQREAAPVPLAARLCGQSVFRGRCVDPSGQALAGVQVKVRGWTANSERMAAYRREHGELVWEDPEPLVTGGDGHFAVSFVPPPPYQFVLDLEHPDFAPVGGRWGKIEPGEEKDFGDVVLPIGALVTGRVVDVDGVPQQGIRVRLDRYNRRDRPRSEIHPDENDSARTKADGSFRMRKLLAPATWNLSLREVQLAEPRKEVEIELPSTTLELVVKRVADVPTIRGVVVNENGDPIRGARVNAMGSHGSGWLTSSKKDGSFRLQAGAGDDANAKYPLRVERRGYEFLQTDEAYKWGAENVRLTLRAGIDVRVAVVRDDDGTPVEEFALRAFPKPGTTGRWSSDDARARGGWEHEGGVLVLKGMRRGPNVLVAEPRAGSGLAASEVMEIEVRDGPALALQLRLPTVQQQAVRVVHADGSPVAGSAVELLEASPGTEVTVSTRATRPDSYGWLQPSTARRIDEATTDSDGKCVVQGASHREHCLRVVGTEHMPFLQVGVVLSDTPIECVIPTGAAIRVRLQPLELLEDLRELAQLPRQGAVAKGDRLKLPGIRLSRGAGADVETVPVSAHPHALFDEHGVAVLRGVPPGTWDLQLVSSKSHREGSYSTGAEVVRPGVSLVEGQEVAIELNLSGNRLGRVRGTVMVAGKPFVGGLVLRGELGVQPGGAPPLGHGNAVCDATGSFEALLAPGIWRVAPWILEGGRGFAAWSNQTVRVVSAETAMVAFDVRLAKVKLRLVQPDGQPLAGVPVSLLRDGQMLAHTAATDAAGRTTVTTTPGSATPKVVRRSFMDPAKQREFYMKHRGDPAAHARMQVTMPPIVLLEGEQDEIEIRLSAEWDR